MQNKLPALRFAPFADAWERKKLGEITHWASGGTPSKEYLNYWNGDIAWISASSMRGLEYADSVLKITQEGLEKGSKLAKKGSLLMLVRGSMLFNKIPIGMVTRDVAFNQDVKSISVHPSALAKYILQWVLASENKLLNMVTGTGIGAGKLELEDLKALEINLPSLPEQTKIATFFSAIDTRIAQLQTKKRLLEQYKKGVMQQIFAQTLRFKDENGDDFPDWEVKKLGEIGRFFSGGTPLTSKKHYFNGNIPFIRSGEIKADTTEQYISEAGLNDSSAKMIEVGDLIYALYGATSGEVAISKIKGAINQAILCIRTSLNNTFLLNYFLFQKESIVNGYLQGGQGNLSAEIIKSLMIPVPNLAEQNQIATFLSAIDARLTVTQRQIEQTETWKKGLFQRLFV